MNPKTGSGTWIRTKDGKGLWDLASDQTFPATELIYGRCGIWSVATDLPMLLLLSLPQKQQASLFFINSEILNLLNEA